MDPSEDSKVEYLPSCQLQITKQLNKMLLPCLFLGRGVSLVEAWGGMQRPPPWAALRKPSHSPGPPLPAPLFSAPPQGP